MFNEYEDLDALALAELVRTKQVTSLELVDAAIARIEAHDPSLNAVCRRMFDEARDTARAFDAGAGGVAGPFGGVPMLVKDILASVAGHPTESGSRFLRGAVAPHDSFLVARMRAAGFVFVGKSSTPELGLLPTTEPVSSGVTRNPWDLSRSPGGSSGGAAAAVAARYLPLAHASDGGGSIRIPAACCGLFGLKPTRGRTTLGPLLGDVMNGMVVEHAVSRSVRDSAAFLDAVHGPAPGDPYVAPPPRGSFLEATRRPPGPLRVAMHLESAMGNPVDPEVLAAVRDAAALLESLGHRVDEVKLPLDAGEFQQAMTGVWLAGAAAAVDGLAHLSGRSPKTDELEPVTRALASLGRKVPASAYLLAVAALQGATRRIADFQRTYDVLLSPVTAELPLPIGALAADEDGAMGALLRAGAYTPFTPLANATGQPAMSVPLAMSSNGLPIGVQFAGRSGDEELLLSLAAELERARPWASRRPSLRQGS
jgi:amidase